MKARFRQDVSELTAVVESRALSFEFLLGSAIIEPLYALQTGTINFCDCPNLTEYSIANTDAVPEETRQARNPAQSNIYDR